MLIFVHLVEHVTALPNTGTMMLLLSALCLLIVVSYPGRLELENMLKSARFTGNLLSMIRAWSKKFDRKLMGSS